MVVVIRRWKSVLLLACHKTTLRPGLPPPPSPSPSPIKKIEKRRKKAMTHGVAHDLGLVERLGVRLGVPEAAGLGDGGVEEAVAVHAGVHGLASDCD